MNSLISRGNLFDDFFRDVAPGFYVKPLHGDPLPTPASVNSARFRQSCAWPGQR